MKRIGVQWPVYFTVVMLVCAATFISYIDRTNISVGAIAMQAQFGWTETQKGLVLSAFFVGYIMMMVASGALAHRFGGKPVLGIAVIWWSLFTGLTGACTAFGMLMIVRIIFGAGEAGAMPNCARILTRWFPTEARGFPQGLESELDGTFERVRAVYEKVLE